MLEDTVLSDDGGRATGAGHEDKSIVVVVIIRLANALADAIDSALDASLKPVYTPLANMGPSNGATSLLYVVDLTTWA